MIVRQRMMAVVAAGVLSVGVAAPVAVHAFDPPMHESTSATRAAQAPLPKTRFVFSPHGMCLTVGLTMLVEQVVIEISSARVL